MSHNSKSHVDFSIIIPTYNRSQLLRLAILSALRQKGVSFEVIVGDNASKDNTEKVIKDLKDNRIRYIKNQKNLGYAPNVIKLFNESKGGYIFTIGDDDFILDENTLKESLKVMRRYKVGMAKIGTISYATTPNEPYKTSILGDKLIILKKKENRNIILKSSDFGLGFFSGLIFDNSMIDKNLLTNHHAYTYLPLAFDVILKHGIAYIPKVFLIAKLSTNPEHMAWYLNLEKYGGYFIEEMLNIVKKFVSEKEYREYVEDFMRKDVFMLPSYKYFSSTANYIKILQRSIKIDKTLITNPMFIIFALLGFLPNFIIRSIHTLMVFYSKNKVRQTVAKYDYFQKIKKLGIE